MVGSVFLGVSCAPWAVITWIPGALPLPASRVSRNARARTASGRCESAASRLHGSRDPRIQPVWCSLRYVTRRAARLEVQGSSRYGAPCATWRAAPPGSRSKDPSGMVLPALRDAPPFVYAAGGVGPTIGGESRLHRPAWSVVISRSPTHQRERHTCPPPRQLGHCPRSTYAAAAPHLAQPQLKTCSFPRFSCTRKRINLPRTKCELAVVKFDLLMCV
jgi:hypothetical protein